MELCTDINTTYDDGAGNARQRATIDYAGLDDERYLTATSLSDAQILQVVSDALAGKHLPHDTDAIYFVLTSSEVTASSGFCTQYCGWHTAAHHGGAETSTRSSATPIAARRPARATTGPNANAGADGMASIIAHESEEAISDPDINAWTISRGEENADKCAWTFGSERRPRTAASTT